MKDKVTDYIYFDNNATIPMFPEVISSYSSVAQCGNVSSSNPVAKIWVDNANNFEWILHEQFMAPSSLYKLIWTSGSTESNCTMVDMFTVNALTPRLIVCSTIEHKCLLESVKQASQTPGVEVLWIAPDITGTITVDAVREQLIIADQLYPGYPCLLCVMNANNETGAINDLYDIALGIREFHSSRNIFFYSDCAQTAGKLAIGLAEIDWNTVPYFGKNNKVYVKIPGNEKGTWEYIKIQGKEKLNEFIHYGNIRLIVDNNEYIVDTIPLIDGICFSGHKLGGPFGIGILMVSKRFLEFKNFIPITGAQNDGLRGGTINMPGIIGTRVAFLKMMAEHKKIVTSCIDGKKEIINAVSSSGIPCIKYHEYLMLSVLPKKAFVYFDSGNTLPGTLLCSIVYNNCYKQICNISLKQFLESRSIVLSIGSACNSASKGMSHVLKAVNCPIPIALGILRISSYNNSYGEYVKMGNVLVEIFKKIDSLCIDRPSIKTRSE